MADPADTDNLKGGVTIVCGGRDYQDVETIREVLEWVRPEVIRHGGARGADNLAGIWARRNGVPTIEYSADWDRYGKAAGPIRNLEMAKAGARVCVSFAGGRGTANMERCAIEAGIPVVRAPRKFGGEIEILYPGEAT